jgi:hypothetical protein
VPATAARIRDAAAGRPTGRCSGNKSPSARWQRASGHRTDRARCPSIAAAARRWRRRRVRRWRAPCCRAPARRSGCARSHRPAAQGEGRAANVPRRSCRRALPSAARASACWWSWRRRHFQIGSQVCAVGRIRHLITTLLARDRALRVAEPGVQCLLGPDDLVMISGRASSRSWPPAPRGGRRRFGRRSGRRFIGFHKVTGCAARRRRQRIPQRQSPSAQRPARS